MKVMCSTMLECAHKLMNHMDALVDSERHLEDKEMSARFTTDILRSCVFGLQADAIANPGSDFRKMGIRHLPVFIQKLFDVFKSRQTHVFFLKLVRDTVKLQEGNNIVRNDFLQLLMEIRNKANAEKLIISTNSTASENTLNA
ncbi:hypothetical protein PR048_012283 [Dryococelus australis]|uniref:Uncharacterized protein n=1 Tax=Dryococelus australis TaxID=614101 RepID=A0ABQ9HP25_9NEOP|nr:hypothetical protein PR048_012283 [Dryococelus australis]